MVIAIEGVDGTGKTSVAKELANKLNFKYVEKPFSNVFQQDKMPKYLEIKDGLNKQKNKNLLAWFYGLNILFCKDYFKSENIVCDRFLVSNFSWILDETNEIIFETMLKLTALPELTVLLTASQDVLNRRIEERDNLDKDLCKLQYANSAYQRSKYLLKKHKIPYIEINVDNTSISQVVEAISKEVDIIFNQGLI